MSDVARIAASLTANELKALLQLREDGRGNYDPKLTKARQSLERKGLADGPMGLGFGRTMIACVQTPTELGLAVQKHLLS
jgi:hypothetical protein